MAHYWCWWYAEDLAVGHSSNQNQRILRIVVTTTVLQPRSSENTFQISPKVTASVPKRSSKARRIFSMVWSTRYCNFQLARIKQWVPTGSSYSRLTSIEVAALTNVRLCRHLSCNGLVKSFRNSRTTIRWSQQWRLDCWSLRFLARLLARSWKQSTNNLNTNFNARPTLLKQCST